MWNMNCLTAEACDGAYANMRWYRFIAMIVVNNASWVFALFHCWEFMLPMTTVRSCCYDWMESHANQVM